VDHVLDESTFDRIAVANQRRRSAAGGITFQKAPVATGACKKML
jgi:hypothetical protein